MVLGKYLLFGYLDPQGLCSPVHACCSGDEHEKWGGPASGSELN